MIESNYSYECGRFWYQIIGSYQILPGLYLTIMNLQINPYKMLPLQRKLHDNRYV